MLELDWFQNFNESFNDGFLSILASIISLQYVCCRLTISNVHVRPVCKGSMSKEGASATHEKAQTFSVRDSTHRIELPKTDEE